MLWDFAYLCGLSPKKCHAPADLPCLPHLFPTTHITAVSLSPPERSPAQHSEAQAAPSIRPSQSGCSFHHASTPGGANRRGKLALAPSSFCVSTRAESKPRGPGESFLLRSMSAHRLVILAPTRCYPKQGWPSTKTHSVLVGTVRVPSKRCYGVQATTA